MTRAATRGPALSLYWRVHRLLYQLSDGRVGARMFGWDVLELTTRGRKSGVRRRVMLNYFRDGQAYVVIGSNVGGDRDPSWWMNLKVDPDADVRIGTKRLRLHAREAVDTERQLLWQKLIAKDPSYTEYAQRTSRRISVVILRP